MRVTEFYPKKQGRPYTPITADLESGQTALHSSYISMKEEYNKVEALLDKLLNEQIGKLHQLIIEVRQVKLHLASGSDEAIDEEDAEEE